MTKFRFAQLKALASVSIFQIVFFLSYISAKSSISTCSVNSYHDDQKVYLIKFDFSEIFKDVPSTH